MEECVALPPPSGVPTNVCVSTTRRGRMHYALTPTTALPNGNCPPILPAPFPYP